MIHEPLMECSFLIPISRDVNLSDGGPHDPAVWGWLDDELFIRCGGRTLAPGLYEGFYTDPDTAERVPDQSRKFIVAVAESHLDELRKFLSAACVLFQQKCIYLSVGGQVEFIEAPDHEPP